MSNSEVFGAFASIHIRYEGDIRDLAKRLAAVLNLGTLTVEPDEYPPHQDIGSAEALGWELWLQPASDARGCFILWLETEDALDEVFYGRLYDLSPWLARLIAALCDLETEPIPRPSRGAVPSVSG
ncbi:MAG: hypothetical protein ACREDR_15455 [Blastocatellia bacterium]